MRAALIGFTLGLGGERLVHAQAVDQLVARDGHDEAISHQHVDRARPEARGEPALEEVGGSTMWESALNTNMRGHSVDFALGSTRSTSNRMPPTSAKKARMPSRSFQSTSCMSEHGMPRSMQRWCARSMWRVPTATLQMCGFGPRRIWNCGSRASP